jgi:hypothetical protein
MATERDLAALIASGSETTRRLNSGILTGPAKAHPAHFGAISATIRHTTDEDRLNKTERLFLAYLRALNAGGWVGVQCLTLKLGHDTRYTPDFWSWSEAGELCAWEVKGFFRDDAKVKIKVAARMFPRFVFTLAFKSKEGWEFQEVKP